MTAVPQSNQSIPSMNAVPQNNVPAMATVPQSNQSIPAMTAVPQNSVPAITAVPQSNKSVPAMNAAPQSNQSTVPAMTAVSQNNQSTVPAMTAVPQSNQTAPAMIAVPQSNQATTAVPQFNHAVFAKTAVPQRNQNALDPRLTQGYYPRTNLMSHVARTKPMYGATIGNTLPQRNYPTVIDGRRLPHNYISHTMLPSPNNSYRNYVSPSQKQTTMTVPHNNVIHVLESPHTVLTLPATQYNSQNQKILAVPTGRNVVQYISLEQHGEQRSPRTPKRSSTSLKQVSYSRADSTTSERSMSTFANSRSYKKSKSLFY